MVKKINKKFLIFLLIFISMGLTSALIIEYILDHQPCKLCLYQRIPYFLSIFLILKILIVRGYEKITLLILALTFVISSLLAFYHFGIEQGFFKESLACTATNLSENLSKDQLLAQLKQNIISCRDVNFKIFGFSLATINTIFSICLSAIFIRLFVNYGKN